MKNKTQACNVTRRHFSVFVLWLAIGFSGSAAITPDTKEKNWPANPEKHRIAIRREVADPAHEKWIAAAEAARPDPAALRKAIGEGSEPKDASQWWYREELGIRIPFAVTGQSVDYYTKLVGDYGKKDFKRFLEPYSSFDYHATAVFHEQFERDGQKFAKVHVVTLKIVFDQNFAATGTEGMHFEKTRTVVLDATGKVLAVYGDGKTEAAILAL